MRRERQRLAGGYFFYFATIGLFVPFWPPYLAARGLDPVEIGLVMGLVSAMRIIGPPVYAHWADVTGRRLALLRAASVLAFGCALSFPRLNSIVSMAAVLACYSVAWNGVMSVYDAHVLDRLGADAGRYGLLRLWGSIGFIVVAVSAGRALDAIGLAQLPLMLALLVGLTWASMLGLEAGATRDPVPAHRARLAPALADPRVRAFLAIAFLMVASHGAYYNFFSIYLAEHGYGRTAIGMLWAWASTAEIGVFVLGARLLERFTLRALTMAALAATGLRWLALALFPGLPWVVFASQTLHLASFGLFHLCAVNIARLLFPAGAVARGQALYGSVGYGLGGMAGALASGWLWGATSPQTAFLASALTVLVALALAVPGLRGLPDVARKVQNA